MRVQSLAQKDPLEEGMATHSRILAWRIPWTEDLVGYSPQGCKESHRTAIEQQQCVCRQEILLQRVRLYSFRMCSILSVCVHSICAEISY